MEPLDILGLGCAAVDDVLYVPSLPGADRKVRVENRQRRCGGLTATALVTAARLGARCAYAGWLGSDDCSAYVAQFFRQEGVDTSEAPRSSEARVVRSTIVVANDTGERNIFYEYGGWIGAHPTLPDAAIIHRAKVLFIDHLGMPGNLRAARLARAAGIPVVADFEDDGDPAFAEVLALVDHLILSEEFAGRITRTARAEDATGALWRDGRAVVVVTCGASGGWVLAAGAGSTPRRYSAFPVAAIDTTGCGDVFHGAYAASLAWGDPLERRIRLASAAAAFKAQHGCIPRREALDQFLATFPRGPKE